MELVKAVIFDFVSTLVVVENCSLEASMDKIYNGIVAAGFNKSRKVP